jgi:hypothetical protein
MDLDPYVAAVTDQLTASAALGDDRTRQIASALAVSAASAIRLATINAVSAAVDEVNTALLAGPASSGITVSVRLENDEPVISVHEAPDQALPAEPADSAGDGEASARISLRLPETLKADIDAAASAASVSVNTWLVRAARAGLAPSDGPRTTRTGHHIRGWVTG